MPSVEPDREMATIVTITKFIPIEGADRIVVANLKENIWNVVVNKNDFKVGDTVVLIVKVVEKTK